MSNLAAGKRALITGAAQGIGRGVARALAGRGMELVLVDLPGERLTEAATSLNARAEAVDVSDAAAMSDLAARVGPVDLLFNNAASFAGRGMEADLAEWHQLTDVNFWGVVHGVRAFLPAMLERGSGTIVNTGSKQGMTNPPGHPIYNAMKAALKSYTESLAHDLHQKGDAVSVHLLVPGFTRDQGQPGAWTSDQVAEVMIKAVEAGDFYILCPDNEVTVETDHKRLLWAAGDVIENRPPLSRWHADWKEKAAAALS